MDDSHETVFSGHNRAVAMCELKVALTRCTRPVQAQTTQNSHVEGRMGMKSHSQLRSCWKLMADGRWERGGSCFFKDEVSSGQTRLQWKVIDP